MKKVRVDALRKARGAFLILHQHELEVLDSLPLWMTRVFLALLRCTDFETGIGDTTYAHLVAACTPLQPRSGPRHYAPDEQAVKKAVRGFELRRVIARDKEFSQGERRLFFMAAPRYAKARPKPKLEPQTRTPVDSRKPSNGAASSRVAGGTRTPNSTPSSTAEFIHSKEGELSTDTGFDERLELAAAVRDFAPAAPPHRAEARSVGDVLRGAFQQPPPGGEEVAPSGRTPPGPAEPSPTVKVMRAQLKPQQTDEGPRPSDRLRQRRAQAANPASQRGGAPKASG